MHYKGKTTYRTLTGGFCYLFLSIVTIWFAVAQVIKMLHMSDPNVNKNTIYHDGDAIGVRTAKELSFDIGIGAYGFSDRGANTMHDLDGHGSFRLFQTSY